MTEASIELISIKLCVKFMVMESCESVENKCHSSRGDACEDNCLEESCYEVVFSTATSVLWLLCTFRCW